MSTASVPPLLDVKGPFVLAVSPAIIISPCGVEAIPYPKS